MRLVFFSLFILIAFPFEASAGEPSLWTDFVHYIRSQQQSFHRELAGAIRAIQTGGLYAVWGMVSLSFLYGVFHAAGPGHGKAIISTYLVSRESKFKQGILLSFSAAFLQGVTAIFLVEIVAGLLSFTNRQVQGFTPYLEQLSFALITLIGLMLVKRAVTMFWRQRKAHHHDHHHQGHDHACESCGHSHALSPDDLSDNTNWKEVLGLVFSVGIRPCSGSVLVLVFAELIALRWAGIASVFAISLGTAITVSFLAILAISFRRTALLIAAKQDGNLLKYLSQSAVLIGGLIITLLGISLFIDSSLTSHPLF